MVLHRERRAGGGMAALEAIVRIPMGLHTGAVAFGVPRQSRVAGIAPIGRCRTFPGARMQFYSNPSTQTVDPRHVRGRPLARSL